MDSSIQQNNKIDPAVDSLSSLVQFLEKPEDFLHSILLPPKPNEDDDLSEYTSSIDLLVFTSKYLFRKLEQLASYLDQIDDSNMGKTDDDECPLSGLIDLYTGDLEESKDNLDTETIWGQVDIQNQALLAKLSKIIRRLSKKVEIVSNHDEQIQLIDMNGVQSDESGDKDEYSDDDMNSSYSAKRNDSDEEDEEQEEDEEEDDDARRARERMERSMAAMENSDESDLDESADMNESSDVKEKAEQLYDRSREELNDGFFDLHEMEAFADEEEEMLPNEAYGEPNPDYEDMIEKNKSSLPHRKGRTGEESDGSDEEFDALERKFESKVRRQKYRDDEDINALASMYKDDDLENEDIELDDEDVVNMTAADFFGPPRQPSKEYTNGLKRGVPLSRSNDDFDDADSWNDHNFEDDNDFDWRNSSSANAEKDLENPNHDSDTSEDEVGDDDEAIEEKKESEDPKQMSNYKKRSQKLEDLTQELEQEMLAEKPWQMLGETTGTKRPENSLLEATPEFEFATKMAPIITAEHTESIEEMIKRRILAEDWDDVIPRELPDIGLDKRNGELPEVSQEKSKLSLGELYEREYLKKAVGYDKDAVEKESEEEKAKNEMRMLFANLCSKLDALSNYHFTPRPVADEANIKTSDTPAIAMEEVLPLHVSDSQALAPEEVYGKKKGRDGILRSESEMSQADRKRMRQAKKAARRKARKAKLADEKIISRLKPELGLNNPYEKRKLREELQMARASGKVVKGEVDRNSDYKTSAKFFQKMQSHVQSSIRDGNDDSNGSKKRKADQDSVKSSKFKL
jgi:U3 small nucleolar RNA-associated protein MPP10